MMTPSPYQYHTIVGTITEPVGTWYGNGTDSKTSLSEVRTFHDRISNLVDWVAQIQGSLVCEPAS